MSIAICQLSLSPPSLPQELASLIVSQECVVRKQSLIIPVYALRCQIVELLNLFYIHFLKLKSIWEWKLLNKFDTFWKGYGGKNIWHNFVAFGTVLTKVWPQTRGNHWQPWHRLVVTARKLARHTFTPQARPYNSASRSACQSQKWLALLYNQPKYG